LIYSFRRALLFQETVVGTDIDMRFITGDDTGLWKVVEVEKRQVARKVLGGDYKQQSRDLGN
jgi:hypothetical protein